VNVLPAWRPDSAMMVEDPAVFNAYVAKLEAASGKSVSTFDEFMAVWTNGTSFSMKMAAVCQTTVWKLLMLPNIQRLKSRQSSVKSETVQC
jgi:hypothetical protein